MKGCGVKFFVNTRVSERETLSSPGVHTLGKWTTVFCFASPQENGAKESEHRGGEPHPRIARPLEFKQHAENSRRLVSQGETQAGTSGAVMRSLCIERLIYRVAGRVHVEKVATTVNGLSSVSMKWISPWR